MHVLISNILISQKVVTKDNKNSYFRPNIMPRHIMYVYDGKYFLGTFFNRGKYTKLGKTPEQL